MPDRYFFTGYMAFVLFGPDGLSNKRLSCLSPDGEDVDIVGRDAARKEAAKSKKEERAAGNGGFVPDCYARGVNLKEKASAAHLAQNGQSEASRNILGLLNVCTNDHFNILGELDRAEQHLEKALSRTAVNECEIKYLENWKASIFDRLEKNNKRKLELEDESDRLRASQPKRQVTAFYEQVGEFTQKEIAVSTVNDDASSLTTPRRSPVILEEPPVRYEDIAAAETNVEEKTNDEDAKNDDDYSSSEDSSALLTPFKQ